MKILFLYTELAGYFISCLRELSKKGVEIHIVHWPVNPEAPFVFSLPEGVKPYDRKKFNSRQLAELAKKISPDAIYCSGWIDKDYLKVCKDYRSRIPVIVGFDNKWKGTLKQKAGSLLSKILIHRYFSHCWIPGKPQLSYAHHLKFVDENILTGFYSCDYDFYQSLYEKHMESKRKKFPHRLIFVGRYYDFKGVTDLWSAFIELQKESPNDWELWCLGVGDIAPIVHPRIRHFGFIQPDKMEKFISESGVFVLPSRFEPWGVAVHEFASAGFPLICSDEVGAASDFLTDGQNGFLFRAGHISELKIALKKMLSLSDESLFKMGEKSAERAAQITPGTWSNTLISAVVK